jgi:hypothetical protein
MRPLIAAFASASISFGIACASPPDTSAPRSDQPETNKTALVTCGQGFHRECDPNCEGSSCGKPICTCEENSPTVVSGLVTPDLLITHVIYAVPGRASSVQYTGGTTLGSTTTSKNSFKQEMGVTFSGSAGKVPATSSFELSVGSAWASSRTDAMDVTLKNSSGYKKTGQVDVVDHDDDEVWFMIRPALEVTVSTPAPPGLPRKVSWKFAAAQPEAVSFFLYVKHLKNPSLMPEGDRVFLEHFGISSDRFPEILNADPFAFVEPGTTVAIDRTRFDAVAAFTYMHPVDPGDQASTQTYGLTRTVTNSTMEDAEYSYSVGFKVSAGFSFFDAFNATLALQDKFTWTSSSSRKIATGSDEGETVTVGQPSQDYQGPAILRVYVDKIWKTFVFNLEPF